ncbi:hypothetical protein RF11_00859 [Thelohanellus kitauei]|uniref:Integrase catalytic domain-containing protein n=1 Tax=Thelohanellus kitauei TaxID=669202 RepID=A0A0C2J511_THEKT|nr:hypothetical protein RF11_00859 [Thelohanellus kitauei]
MIQRQSMVLLGYDYTEKYRSTKEHVNGDALSGLLNVRIKKKMFSIIASVVLDSKGGARDKKILKFLLILQKYILSRQYGYGIISIKKSMNSQGMVSNMVKILTYFLANTLRGHKHVQGLNARMSTLKAIEGCIWLIIVGAYSHFPSMVEISGFICLHTITALQISFAVEGLPETIVSDNGKQYMFADSKISATGIPSWESYPHLIIHYRTGRQRDSLRHLKGQSKVPVTIPLKSILVEYITEMFIMKIAIPLSVHFDIGIKFQPFYSKMCFTELVCVKPIQLITIFNRMNC